MGREGRVETTGYAGGGRGRPVPMSVLVVVLLVLFFISWVPFFIYDRYWTTAFPSLAPSPTHIVSIADGHVHLTNTHSHTSNIHLQATNINYHVKNTQSQVINNESHVTNIPSLSTSSINATNTHSHATNLPPLTTSTYIPVTKNTHSRATKTHSNTTGTTTYTNATNTPFHTRINQTNATNTPFHANPVNNSTNNIYGFSNITNTHTHNRNTHTNIYAYGGSSTINTTSTNDPQRSASNAASSAPAKAFDALCEEKYQEEGPRRKVVLWTKFWHSWEGWKEMIHHHGALREGRCPMWRCEFLKGPEVTTDQVKEADAVIFFSLDVLSRPLPPRSPHTLWIWLELEAPPISQLATPAWSQLEQAGVVFNLTMSYHHLSSITAIPGQLVPLSTPQHCPLPSTFYLDTSSPTYTSYSRHMHEFDAWLRENREVVDEKLRAKRDRRHGGLIHRPGDKTILTKPLPDEYSAKNVQGNETSLMDDDESTLTAEEIMLATRPRLAVWMASHCRTYSRREAVVAALQRFMAITTLGKCGKLRCGKNHMDTYCYRWLAASHLFYLSFENALCDDYHTEKLWIPLEHGMVPVVYGAHTHRHILPFDSYIEVSNFSSAAALATHLLYLANHPSEYLRHLQWRRYWTVHWPVPWCGLCATVHRQSHPARTTLDQWWNNTATCYDPVSW